MAKIYKIEGMHCASCATMIELDLEDAGIKSKCSYADSTLKVEGDHDHDKLTKVVSKSGYSISPTEN